MGYQEIIRQVFEDIRDVVGAALLHKNGFVVTYIGLEKETWVYLTDVLKNVLKVAEFLESDLYGVDVMLEKYKVAIRKRENLVAIVVTTPDIDSHISDYAAFRLLEEALKL